MVAGTDPMAERKAEGEAKQQEIEARQREADNSFENVARDWWKWWLIGKSPRHADTTMRRMEAEPPLSCCDHPGMRSVVLQVWDLLSRSGGDDAGARCGGRSVHDHAVGPSLRA